MSAALWFVMALSSVTVAISDGACDYSVMSDRYFIYGLRDPRTMEIRYVGQSSRGMKRPKQHTRPNNLKNDHFYVVRWLKSINCKPEIVVLERLRIDCLSAADRCVALNDAEIRWIALGRLALGKRLTNLTIGGGGTSGYKKSPEAKERERVRRCAWEKTPEGLAWRARQTASMCAFWKTPEGLAKAAQASEKKSAFAQSPDGLAVAAARSEKYKARAATTEGRAILESMRDKACSPEVSAKMSISQRARFATPEGRENQLKTLALTHTPEAISRMAATLRARAMTPEGRAAMDAMRQCAKTTTVIAKMSASKRAVAATPEGQAHIKRIVALAHTPEARAKWAISRSKSKKGC